MALVKILNNWKNPGWRSGDHVEMSGDQLKEWLDASAVEVIVPDIEVKPEIVEEVKIYGRSSKTVQHKR